MKICSVENCQEKTYGKGYCRRHYDKWRNHGSPLAGWDWDGSKIQEEICSVEACSKVPLAKGLCSAHYALNRRTGSVDKTYIRGTCELDNCSQPHIAKGLCSSHYSKERNHGDPLWEPVKAPPKKMVDRNGYIELTNMQDYVGSKKNGRIFEHRYVMAEYLRRPLLPHENVHHLNGQRDDNRIENLELWSKSQPSGQRVEDKTKWAVEWLQQYAPELLVTKLEN